VLAVGVSSIAVGLSEGLISYAGLIAMNIQPKAQGEIRNAIILGMALSETAAILSGVIAIVLLVGNPTDHANLLVSGIAKMGIGTVISLTGGVIGIVSYMPAQAACFAIARQPFISSRITNIMLITLSLIQTPSIFGFIVAFLIHGQLDHITTLADGIRLFSGGLCVGLGSIGPAIGLAIFARQACTGPGINREAYNRILSFTFLSGAIIETPIILSLLISLILVGSTTLTVGSLTQGMALLAASICIGLSTFGAGISSGRTAAAACRKIAFSPELFPVLSRTSLLAQGLLDTIPIYGLLISLVLIFLTR